LKVHEHVARKLLEGRARKKMSAYALAKAAGVSESLVGRYEGRTPTPSGQIQTRFDALILRRFARVLEMSMDEIVGTDDDELEPLPAAI
jgi:transcriptional regulator with XRE-family HTH domain